MKTIVHLHDDNQHIEEDAVPIFDVEEREVSFMDDGCGVVGPEIPFDEIARVEVKFSDGDV